MAEQPSTNRPQVTRADLESSVIVCRTSQGEDVHVPVSVIVELLATKIAQQLRTQGGQSHGVY